MAVTGTINLRTESVDWIGHNYPGPFGRGSIWLNTTVRWTISDSGIISFHHEGQSSNKTSWGICGVNSNYRICAEAQYNTGNGWYRLAFRDMGVAICPSLTNTISVVSSLVNNLPTAQLTQGGQLRLLYYANSDPAPTQKLPRAFPSSVYSQATQVPIWIELDYRPGAILNSNGEWVSHNRGAGTSHIYTGTQWSEMTTTDGNSSSGNPPAINDGSKWANMDKIGKE